MSTNTATALPKFGQTVFFSLCPDEENNVSRDLYSSTNSDSGRSTPSDSIRSVCSEICNRILLESPPIITHTPPTSPRLNQITMMTPIKREAKQSDHLGINDNNQPEIAPKPPLLSFMKAVEITDERSQTEPLMQSSTDSQGIVCLTDQIVFKPYIIEAKQTKMCQAICKCAQIIAMPESTIGSASIQLRPKTFLLMLQGRKQVLVPQDLVAADSDFELDNKPLKDSKAKIISCMLFGNEVLLTPLEGTKDQYLIDHNLPTSEYSTEESSEYSTEESSEYSTVESSEEECYSSSESQSSTSSTDSSSESSFANKLNESYQTSSSETFNEFLASYKNTPFKILKTTSSSVENWYLIPAKDCHPLHKENNTSYCVLDGQKFSVQNTDNNIEIKGHNLLGLYQERISNLLSSADQIIEISQNNNPSFQIPTPNRSRLTFDLRVPSLLNDKFYELIDMKGFIDAFLLLMLSRHPDGKASTFESNILFKIVPINQNKKTLMPYVIDFAGAIGPSNQYREELPGVHVIRNGLMAFPQSYKPLEIGQKLRIIHSISQLHKNKEPLIKSLYEISNDKKIFDRAHETALTDLIDKMILFVEENTSNNEWTLQDLMFSAFPEYQEQWNELDELAKEPISMHQIDKKYLEKQGGKLKINRGVKASMIGSATSQGIIHDLCNQVI